MGETRLRVVCDTNVVVSALLFSRGHLAWLRQAWHEGTIVPLVCRATVTELLRVLTYPKFRLGDTEREELLGDFLPFSEVTELNDPLTLPECRDPHDLVFLHLALSASADLLATGDSDLLALKDVFPVPIVTPSELRDRTTLTP